LTKPVFIRRAAELELAAAEDWYEAQRKGLGSEFRAEVDHLLSVLAAHPLMFPERYRGNRRAILGRFPYLIWYRVTPDAVIVVVCIDARRHPRLGRARLRERS
jgi:plasmid stabilization system protein ParE